MKDRDLKAVQERIEAVAERVSSIGEAQDRNDDAVHQLAGALSDLVTRMRRQDRVLSLNSFVAYAIFTVLLGAAFFLLYRGRADDLVRERDQAIAGQHSAEERSVHATRTLAAREDAEQKSAELYAMLRDHRYKEAIAAHTALADARLSESERGLFDEAIERARGQLAQDALERAREALARGEHERALKEAQSGLDSGARSEQVAELHYIVGASLAKAGRDADAVLEIEKALAGGAEKTVPDARYTLATVLDKLGRRDDARAAYRTFTAGSPRHPRAGWARQRAWQLAAPPGEREPTPAPKPAAATPAPAAP
jgi:TolA-binding protein